MFPQSQHSFTTLTKPGQDEAEHEPTLSSDDYVTIPETVGENARALGNGDYLTMPGPEQEDSQDEAATRFGEYLTLPELEGR